MIARNFMNYTSGQITISKNQITIHNNTNLFLQTFNRCCKNFNKNRIFKNVSNSQLSNFINIDNRTFSLFITINNCKYCSIICKSSIIDNKLVLFYKNGDFLFRGKNNCVKNKLPYGTFQNAQLFFAFIKEEKNTIDCNKCTFISNPELNDIIVTPQLKKQFIENGKITVDRKGVTTTIENQSQSLHNYFLECQINIQKYKCGYKIICSNPNSFYSIQRFNYCNLVQNKNRLINAINFNYFNFISRKNFYPSILIKINNNYYPVVMQKCSLLKNKMILIVTQNNIKSEIMSNTLPTGCFQSQLFIDSGFCSGDEGGPDAVFTCKNGNVWHVNSCANCVAGTATPALTYSVQYHDLCGPQLASYTCGGTNNVQQASWSGEGIYTWCGGNDKTPYSVTGRGSSQNACTGN